MGILQNGWWASDVVAFLEIGIASVLLLGMFAVRAGHVRLHRVLQTSVVLGNLPIVLIWMVPQYLAYVLPDLPGGLGEPTYWVPTVMLVAGALAEGLGIYIVLVAGTNWIPERYRFRRYKIWMRTELTLWWAVVLTGLTTYLLWYGAAPPS